MNNILIKQFLVMLIACSLLLSQYSVKIVPDSITVTKKDSVAQFMNGLVYGSACQPELQAILYMFVLPPDADMNSVSFSITETSTKILPDEYIVNPIIPPYHLNSQGSGGYFVWPTGIIIENGRDIAIYGKNEFFPANPLCNQNVGEMWQYKLAKIVFYPYQYNPVTKKLKTFIKGVIRVSFSKLTDFPGISIPRDDRTEELLSISIVNPSVFDLYNPTTRIKPAIAYESSRTSDKILIVPLNQMPNTQKRLSELNNAIIYDLSGKIVSYINGTTIMRLPKCQK